MKLKKLMREHPVAGCVAVAVSSFIILGLVSLCVKLLPQSAFIDYGRQIINILWPLGLCLLLGYGWCYRRGSFSKTLLAGLFAFILFSFTFLVRAGEAVFSEETSWKTVGGILLGVLNIIGIGFREETLFRGIIANDLGIAYGKDQKGVWKAVILSGLIFGLAHLTNILFGVQPLRALIQVVTACAVGIYFAAVYCRGQNLWVLMLIHSITDAGGLFRSAFTNEASKVDQLNDLSLNGLIMVPIYIGITIFLLRKQKMNGVLAGLKEAAELDRQ